MPLSLFFARNISPLAEKGQQQEGEQQDARPGPLDADASTWANAQGKAGNWTRTACADHAPTIGTIDPNIQRRASTSRNFRTPKSCASAPVDAGVPVPM